MAAHFPTLPPLSAPSPYVSTWAVPRAPGRRNAISLSPLGAQVLLVPHYEQPRSLRQSKHGIRVTRAPKCPPPLSGLFQSWGTWDTQMPYLPTAHSHWDKILACGARGSVGVPPASVLDSLEEGLQNWVTLAPYTPARAAAACNPGPFVLPHSWAPWSPIPATPPTGRQPPFSGISFNLKQVLRHSSLC